MNPRMVLPLGAALLFLLLLPSVGALAPAPVPSLVAEVERVSFYASPPTQFEAFVNLTWRLSPDDPDQSVGAFNYSLYSNRTTYSTGWLPQYNLSRIPIPARPGWVYARVDFADYATEQSFVRAYNLTVRAPLNAAPNVSTPSCLVSIDAARNGSFSQCGDGIEPPVGVSALVDRAASASDSQTNTTFRWRPSANDTNQSSPEFDYWLYQGRDPTRLRYYKDPPTLESPGVLRSTVTSYTTVGETFPHYAFVVARDPLTHQRSDASCTVHVLGGAMYRAGTCGDIEVPAGGFVGGGPTFPLLDVAATADALDMPEGMLAGVLAATLVLAFACMGWAAGRIVGASVGGLGSLGFATALGLMPLYVLILVFLLSMVLIVFSIKRGGQTA